MEIRKKSDGSINLTYIKNNGKAGETTLGSLDLLENSEVLFQYMISYCKGKRPATIASWVHLFVSSLSPVICSSNMTSLPRYSKDWRIFLKNIYGVMLTGSHTKAKIKTRVKTWNTGIKPFFEFMQYHDVIPIDVVIAKMRKVGQHSENSSFKIRLIGEKVPKLVSTKEYNNLLIPISLSRTDSDYLDEVYFDLEKKRSKIFNCLTSYWHTIKNYYEYGKETIASANNTILLERLKSGDFYTYSFPKNLKTNKKMPPIRRHIAKPDCHEGFSNYLFFLNHHSNMYGSKIILKPCFPKETLKKILSNSNFNPFPESEIEKTDLISTKDKINWCMGNLSNRDISYIMALLIMLNPKFTMTSLLYAKFTDKDGKKLLITDELGVSFSIDKERAKSNKSENLDEVSIEVLTTILDMYSTKRKEIHDKNLKNQLFITPNNSNTEYVIPNMQTVCKWITGVKDGDDDSTCLHNYFPSLINYGLTSQTISHTKIRTTEGVLEWFRTGSIKMTSRKLGNSSKVVLEHYIPKSLVAAWSTRQVRRFQNLLIIAATINEDYLLEAVDFNSLSEVHSFILDMISNNNSSKNPLITLLKKESKRLVNGNSVMPSGDLVASISPESLTSLYTYRNVAIKNNISINTLKVPDKITKISPLAIITLSSHLSHTALNHTNVEIRNAHSKAVELAKKYTDKVNWGNFLITKDSMV